MIEKEYKWTVTQTDFNLTLYKLRQLGLKEKMVIQKNHYYGSSLSSMQDMTVRVREIEGSYSLQTKWIKRTDKTYRVAEEKHQEIEHLPLVLSAQQAGIEEDAEFEYQGVLMTMRHRFAWDPFCHVDLDQNRYFNQEDFEIELEFQQAPPPDILNMFACFQKSADSKYHRFLKVWQLHRPDDSALIERIRTVVAQVFGSAVINILLDEPLVEYGMDSLNMVQLIIALENEFDFELPDYLFDFSAFKNIYNILQLVKFCIVNKMWGEGFEDSSGCGFEPVDSNI